jgi:helix-turn-helix protein
MRRAVVLWGVFVSRFDEALAGYHRRHLTAEEAGDLLGISGRHFRRLCVRFDEDGVEGLRDRRVGRPSPRRSSQSEVARMLGLYREHYADFTVKHFHEVLVRTHGYQLCYTVTRQALQAAGLVGLRQHGPRRKHRKKRLRRPLPGMLLFQDGSTHRWLPDTAGQQDLIVTLDDAAGQITSIFLTDQEGTMSSFAGLAETIRGHGLFGALYTDRGSHYFLTQTVGGKVDKSNLTQVGRALAQLGIRHIPSYSPEARGRMERAFGTLQGRVPQELRLHGLTTTAAANVYLRDVFMADFNTRFGVVPAEPGTAFVPYAGVAGALEDTLCQQLDRQVGRDNCVSWHGRSMQIPAQAHRHHYVRTTIRVHEYPDGRLALFDGPRCLARYAADATLTTPQAQEAA